MPEEYEGETREKNGIDMEGSPAVNNRSSGRMGAVLSISAPFKQDI